MAGQRARHKKRVFQSFINMNIKLLKVIHSNFINELKQSKDGKKTSISFIAQDLTPRSLVKNNEIFQVVIIGGSVFKKAFVKENGKNIDILKLDSKKQPIFRTKKDLLRFLEKELDSQANVLALNFAYPMTPVFENGRLDGVLISGSKENTFKGLGNKKVGKETEDYMKTKGRNIKVIIANDTICLLLSGLTKIKYNDLAAGIVGTGLNFAFFIGKNMAVNLEAANFDKFPKSKEVLKIDKVSAGPGTAFFEKETAGAYLYKHFNLIIKEKKLKFNPISNTKQLNDISRKNIWEISEIARNLIKKSARLTACAVAGIADFKGEDMTFVMEGSLFWKGNNYKKTVEKTIKKLTPRKVTFIEIPNSGIIGAAELVIQQSCPKTTIFIS